ncbi:MAG TPA: hypothetical protein V6C69_15635 [Trichormus sp.]
MDGMAGKFSNSKTLLFALIASLIISSGTAAQAKGPVQVAMPIGVSVSGGTSGVSVSGSAGGVSVSGSAGGISVSGSTGGVSVSGALGNSTNMSFNAYGATTPSINQMAKTYIQDGNQSCSAFMSPSQGGANITDPLSGNPLTGLLNSIDITSLPTKFPPTPEIKFTTQTGAEAAFLKQELQKMNFTGNWPTDRQNSIYNLEAATAAASVARFPVFVASKAQAEQSAQMTSAGNALGEVAKDQATSAIDYCSKYMVNFTVDPSNPWNQLRNQLFVPIGILLFLPGAILSQMRAVVAAGSPVIGELADGTQVCCIDGILRALKGIFLIPATYLVVNWGCDLSKDFIYTCNSEYARIFGSSMYQDALCGEIRAFPNRSYQENLGGANTSETTWPQQKITNVASLENQLFESKVDDPCSKQYSAPQNRSDELMPSSAVFARALAFGSNAALTAAWNVLCAFQQVYLLYLFLVGPVIAGLWVWPTRQLQDALPGWIEGVTTVVFWSLFWNTVIMLMACYKGVSGETGTIMQTAFNILATMVVKYGFDFIGLVKAFGQSAGEKAMSGGGGGSGGKKGGSGSAAASRAGAEAGKKAAANAKTNNPRPTTSTNATSGKHGSELASAPGTEGNGGAPGSTTHGGGGTGGGSEGSGGGSGTGSNLQVKDAGKVAEPVTVPAKLPPTAHGAANHGHAFNGSSNIHLPNGEKYALSLSKNAHGQQIATLRDAKGHAIGSMNLAKGNAKGDFHTAAGDIHVAAAAKGSGWNFSLTSANGQHGQLNLQNYLGGEAPKVSAKGLPEGATAVTSLGDNGNLIRQADGSLAVQTNDGALHALVNGAVDINGNHVEVGYGNTSNGQLPFLEVAQVSTNGLTDVSILSMPSSMVGASADNLNAVPLNEATPAQLEKLGTGDLNLTPNDQGLMIGQISLEQRNDGSFVAGGTDYAYNPSTQSFDVNGVQLPASALSQELLRDANNRMPGAEATMYALSQPGVAENLVASQYDATALQNVQSALAGTGVDVGTLYQASVNGDPLAGVQVLSQEMNANPQYSKNVADSLGLPETSLLMDAAINPIAAAQILSSEIQQVETINPGYEQQFAQQIGVSPTVLTEAASNPFAAAQVLSAELNTYRSPEYMHKIASEMGVSDLVLSSAAQSPIAAAQMVAAETRLSPVFAQETNSVLNGNISQEMWGCAANNPVAAAQIMGAMAQNDSSYGSYVAQTFGTQAVESIVAAANNPTVAAQLVGMEAAQNPAFAQATAQSVPNLDPRLIREAGESVLAATQLAAAEAANNPMYAREISPMMNVNSTDVFNLTAQSSTAAARALGNEAASNPEYANYIANMLHVSPDVVHQAATNPLAAAEIVAAEARLHPEYAAYAREAMQIAETNIFSAAAQSPIAAAQVLGADANMHPLLAEELSNALKLPVNVVKQAGVSPIAASEIIAAQAARNMHRAVVAPPNHSVNSYHGSAYAQHHQLARTSSGAPMSAMIEQAPPPVHRMNESLQSNMGSVQRGVRRIKQSEHEALQIEQGLAKIINTNQTV